jgi:hypothetical protein
VPLEALALTDGAALDAFLSCLPLTDGYTATLQVSDSVQQRMLLLQSTPHHVVSGESRLPASMGGGRRVCRAANVYRPTRVTIRPQRHGSGGGSAFQAPKAWLSSQRTCAVKRPAGRSISPVKLRFLAAPPAGSVAA